MKLNRIGDAELKALCEAMLPDELRRIDPGIQNQTRNPQPASAGGRC